MAGRRWRPLRRRLYVTFCSSWLHKRRMTALTLMYCCSVDTSSARTLFRRWMCVISDGLAKCGWSVSEPMSVVASSACTKWQNCVSSSALCVPQPWTRRQATERTKLFRHLRSSNCSQGYKDANFANFKLAARPDTSIRPSIYLNQATEPNNVTVKQ